MFRLYFILTIYVCLVACMFHFLSFVSFCSLLPIYCINFPVPSNPFFLFVCFMSRVISIVSTRLTYLLSLSHLIFRPFPRVCLPSFPSFTSFSFHPCFASPFLLLLRVSRCLYYLPPSHSVLTSLSNLPVLRVLASVLPITSTHEIISLLLYLHFSYLFLSSSLLSPLQMSFLSHLISL